MSLKANGVNCYVVEEIEHVGHGAHIIELAEGVQAADHLEVDGVHVLILLLLPEDCLQKGRQISEVDPYIQPYQAQRDACKRRTRSVSICKPLLQRAPPLVPAKNGCDIHLLFTVDVVPEQRGGKGKD